MNLFNKVRSPANKGQGSFYFNEKFFDLFHLQMVLTLLNHFAPYSCRHKLISHYHSSN